MTDKELDQLEFVHVRVTPETMDAHLQCLNENGYKVTKKFSLLTNYIFIFLVGMYITSLLR